jgi:shikimate dehydrogenase
MRCAVLGHPVAHSLSPVLHRAAYAALGLDWTYEAVDVTAEDLEGFVTGLDEQWRGLSLTMPLKETVLPLLDEVTEDVRATSAANTVLLGPMRTGANTDVVGIQEALGEAGVTVGAETRAVIVGAGATARSAAHALARMTCGSIDVLARRSGPREQVVAVARAGGAEASGLAWPADAASAGDALTADVVVSTTPAGVTDSWAGALAAPFGVLFDVIYAPWPTAFARAWSAGGGQVIGGLELLLHQAYAQVELMTGQAAPRKAMRAAGESALAVRSLD